MPNLEKSLDLIKDHPIEAYSLEDVYLYLAPRRRKELEEWLNGKTLELKDDKEIIPKYMLDRFFDSVSTFIGKESRRK